jgi:serine/threonine protein kinase
VTAPALTHFGRYRIVRELGRGAMGIVYEAEDEMLQRQVAVKMLMLSDDPEERVQHEARFRQEAKAAGGLSHPNVVTIYDLGREGDWLYIAMELLHGVELRELMNKGTLTLAQNVDLAAQVASGLSAAHRRGIVHRDVKPSNIMVLEGHLAKIMDFGVARMQTSEVKTQTGVMLGSPKYMSPEQVGGHPVDHRSDIFSLGSVLYEMVAGAAPFSGNDLGSLLFDIARADPLPPSQRYAGLPEELDRIVLRALARQPEDRYQDAFEMSQDLARCAAALVAGVPVPLTQPGDAASERTGPVSLHPAEPRPAPPRADSPPDPASAYERTLVAAPSDAAYDKTQVAAVPEADLYDKTVLERPAPPRKAGKAEAEPGLPVSQEFDSAPALERVKQGEPGPVPLTATAALKRWAWPAAYTLAALVALWIAIG